MAIAGKVAITLSTENGGAWSADVTYDRLVAVKHNNNLYISRKTVANVEPPNDEFWFLALEGFGGDDVESILQAIENIINGTTQVGNAKTLDGHEAEYFQTVGGETLGTSILEKALSYTEDGIYNYRLLGGSYTGTDLPNNDYKNGQATVITRVAAGNKYGTTVILWGANNSSYVQRIAVNYYASSGWTGWKEFATTADLAKYLPLTGGTVGSGTNNQPLALKGSTNSFLKYVTYEGVVLGGLGLDSNGRPTFISSNWTTQNHLFHTGNKPTGTYTGNGDATARQIQIGGIGGAVIITNDIWGATIVGPDVAIGIDKNGKSWYFSDSELKFWNGVLTISTVNPLVNNTGSGYFVVSV